MKHLLPTCKTYNLGLLTEEQEDDNSRFDKDFFWCIDPIDGTLAFIKKQAGFSVSIALIAKDGTPQIGVVYDPTKDNLYYAIKDNGVFEIRVEDEGHRLNGVQELILAVKDEEHLVQMFDDFEMITTGYFDQKMFDLKSNHHFIFVGKNNK